MSTEHAELANFIWSVADPLRGNIKQSEYGKVTLPFTVLRRLDCVLEPTKDVVVERYHQALPAYNMGARRSMPDSVSGLAGESGVRL